jgi:hypothetical protein
MLQTFTRPIGDYIVAGVFSVPFLVLAVKGIWFIAQASKKLDDCVADTKRIRHAIPSIEQAGVAQAGVNELFREKFRVIEGRLDEHGEAIESLGGQIQHLREAM